MRDTDGDGAKASGQFTADVTLNAKFRRKSAVFWGEVSNFRGGDHVGADWSVRLTRTKPVTSSLGGRGVTKDGDKENGIWEAIPWARNDESCPEIIAGRFKSEFADGRALGAFQASREAGN